MGAHGATFMSAFASQNDTGTFLAIVLDTKRMESSSHSTWMASGREKLMRNVNGSQDHACC